MKNLTSTFTALAIQHTKLPSTEKILLRKTKCTRTGTWDLLELA